MRGQVLVALALLHGAVMPAGAAEFIPGWKSEVLWNSNVLSTGTDAESDFSFTNGPSLRVREQKGEFTYDAEYRLAYEAYTRLNGINEFDQFFSGTGGWRATANTSFFASNDFAYTSNLNAIFQQSGTGVNEVSVISPTRERITVNTARAGMTHRFGPLWQLSVTGSNDYYDYSDSLQSDSLSTSGTLQLTRSVTPRLLVGGGARIQRQEFGEVADISGRGTTFYQGFGVVQYQISPTLSLVGQGGPAYAVPDQPSAVSVQQAAAYVPVVPSTCAARQADGTPIYRPKSRDPFGGCSQSVYFRANGQPVAFVPATGATVEVPFVGEQQSLDPSLTYFGSLSLEKDWRRWHASVSYQRSASSASGIGTSTNLDLFSGEVTWRPTPHWDVTLSGSYSTQTAISTGRIPQNALATSVKSDRFVITNPNGSTSIVDGVALVGIPINASLGANADNAYDVSSYLLEMRAERRISRRLILDGSVSWFQQKNAGAAILASNETVYRVVFGFTWNFDPIPL
jgi:hypothetical protein